jgi:hypothetical protein
LINAMTIESNGIGGIEGRVGIEGIEEGRVDKV